MIWGKNWILLYGYENRDSNRFKNILLLLNSGWTFGAEKIWRSHFGHGNGKTRS